jgi:hypothetical protein
VSGFPQTKSSIGTAFASAVSLLGDVDAPEVTTYLYAGEIFRGAGNPTKVIFEGSPGFRFVLEVLRCGER